VLPASPTLYLDVALPQGGAFELAPIAAELAVYPVQGTLALDEEPMLAHQMLVLEPGATARVEARGAARFVVVGGDPIGPRHMYWNFVSSRKDRILQASEDWSAGRFGRVPGETEFIPLPPTKFTPPEPMS
jgi:redox-sensitive bicupin YhaK (pirin superfamily)